MITGQGWKTTWLSYKILGGLYSLIFSFFLVKPWTFHPTKNPISPHCGHNTITCDDAWKPKTVVNNRIYSQIIWKVDSHQTSNNNFSKQSNKVLKYIH